MADRPKNAKQRDRNARELERDDAAFVAEQRLLDNAQNAVDIAWLERLAAHPKCLAEVKPSIVNSIAWLKANPMRALHPVFRQKFRSIEYVLKKVDAGEPYEPAKRKRPRGEIRRRAPLPDWMKDPSLLPKSPPGR